ncbi:hypothetical protein KGA66_04645 [Actinocrinis puniceicyclus]|uniref:Uncharacterized protein n=1 Tax=Actinocrinis puniceicyclus TaxID=977794 RepID=A0A8J7WHJ2_9ACTN|nr:hypothetical protein [Actinocrinis puniceicyclus]MBS2962323.1 hypothetical protein [Actinocrinis puniceicyclus]
MDTSGRSSSAGSGWDDQRDERDATVVGHWPDGTEITETECQAPDDLRDLVPELRRYLRQERRARRRARFVGFTRVLGSPRAAIAVVLLAALVASAVAMLLPVAR